MNISVPVSWLRDYLKTDLAAKTIAAFLTASGPSVEHTEKHGEDLIFDVEVTTNRPDAYSIYGLARETNAILSSNNQKSQLTTPKGLDLNLLPETSYQLPLDVLIKNPNLCPRFSAIVVDNVKIGPSPALIKNRLEACGIRPINNIVDITNYVMLELGQPMHAFDFDKIKDAKMTLRASRPGEKITTLDDSQKQIPTGSIVIEDSKHLIDLCGIMGGANSQITTRTKRVLLFAQSYDAYSIRKTTQTLAFRTEAAARFEKGIDMEGVLPALSRSVYLAKKNTGAKIASELIDIVSKKQEAKPITLSINKLNDYLGVEISQDKAAKILNSLGFKSSISNSNSIVSTPPSWRSEDVEIEQDLIEEIARIYGYYNLPSQIPTGPIPQTEESDLTKVIPLKEALKYLGLTEIMTYSIISKEFLQLTGVKEDGAVELANPLTSEWQFMRPTLLVSLADVIAKNQNLSGDRRIKIFEIAKTYIENGDNLPTQDLHLSIVLSGADFYQIKGIIENVFEILKREAEFEKLTKESKLFEKDLSANIIASAGARLTHPKGVKLNSGIVVGTVGILKSEITDQFGIKEPVAAAEINLTTVYSLPTTAKIYHQVPKYPPVIEDISAIFDRESLVTNIITEVKKAGSPLVKQVDILDIYENPKLGQNKKSITLRLTYQKSDATPTQEEVTQTRDRIIKNLEQNLKAQVRR